MEQANELAKTIFKTYKMRVGKDANVYVGLKTIAPHLEFPRYAKMLWRHGMLAEMWGTIATKLSGGKTDYLKAWERGEK